jgi:hypothetical protein
MLLCRWLLSVQRVENVLMFLRLCTILFSLVQNDVRFFLYLLSMIKRKSNSLVRKYLIAYIYIYLHTLLILDCFEFNLIKMNLDIFHRATVAFFRNKYTEAAVVSWCWCTLLIYFNFSFSYCHKFCQQQQTSTRKRTLPYWYNMLNVCFTSNLIMVSSLIFFS